MAIFILDEQLSKSAQMLDDDTVMKQIKEIAQVLCDVHHQIYYVNTADICCPSIPLKTTGKCHEYKGDLIFRNNEWVDWIFKDKAHYIYLLGYSLACIAEYNRRMDITSSTTPKIYGAIEWLRDNYPDLPVDDNMRTFVTPLIVPKKYHWEGEFFKEENVIKSYCAYYKAKVKKLESPKSIFIKTPNDYDSSGFHKTIFPKLRWTKRARPEWL